MATGIPLLVLAFQQTFSQLLSVMKQLGQFCLKAGATTSAPMTAYA